MVNRTDFSRSENRAVFLFLNSTVNPFLTAFRIKELKKSVKIVFVLSHPESEPSVDDSAQLPTTSMRNTSCSL